MENKNKNILSISSGGAIDLLYLKIMKDYLELNKIESNIFFDKFDFFIGTSAGSIIIFLFILQYSIQECYQIYKEYISLFESEIFTIKNIFKLVQGKSIYNVNLYKEKNIKLIEKSPLNKKFKDGYFKDISDIKEINSDNLTLDLISKIYQNKKFYFVTFNLDLLEPIVFTNSNSLNYRYFNQNIDPRKIKLIDCIHKSTSAPGFFEINKYYNYTYIDGALGGLHNPSYLGYLIAKNECENKINLLYFDYKMKIEIKKYDFIQFSVNNSGLNKLLLNLSDIDNLEGINIIYNKKMSGFTNKILKFINNIKIDNETVNKFNRFFSNLS